MAVGQSATSKGLSTLMGQMPVRNDLIAQQQRAARAIQLQQAVASLPAGQPPPSPQQAAALGGRLAAEAGQQQVTQAKETVGMAQQVGQLGLGEQQLAGAAQLQTQQEGARQESLDQTSKLAAIDSRAKQQLVDAELQIKRDSQGRALFTTRQLADYAISSANADEALKNWSQKAKQYSKRNLELMEVQYRKINEALNSGYLDKKTKLDREQIMELQRVKKDVEDRLNRAKAKAANTALMSQALGGLMVAAGTAATATGAGAVVGVPLMVGGASISAGGQVAASKGLERDTSKVKA